MKRILLSCACLTFLLIWMVILHEGRFSPATIQAQSDSPLDLVVVIDNSGSMSKPAAGEADPQGLRYVAAKLLIDLVADDDRVGVVHFSSTPHVFVDELVLMKEPSARTTLKRSIDEARSTDIQGDTNYAPALSETLDLLRGSSWVCSNTKHTQSSASIRLSELI